jgi:hypothetical protein
MHFVQPGQKQVISTIFKKKKKKKIFGTKIPQNIPPTSFWKGQGHLEYAHFLGEDSSF